MRIIGSKKNLLPFIEEGLFQLLSQEDKSHTPSLIFMDGFSGSGAVGNHFKSKFTVYANDIQTYSVIAAKHYLLNNKDNLSYQALLKAFDSTNVSELINSAIQDPTLPEGFIRANYAPNGSQNQTFQRQYFTEENARLIDNARFLLDKWKSEELISEFEFDHLLLSLLQSADKVANTTGVYGAYLKHFKSSSANQFVFKLADIEQSHCNITQNRVFNQDINALMATVKGDILYLDPPYNRRQYCDNYHLLETLARNDNPEIQGKTGLRKDNSQKSDYAKKSTAKEAFKKLIEKADFKYILVSYNSEGLIPVEEIGEIMAQFGEYKLFQQEYRRYKSSRIEGQAPTVVEYLHTLVKR